MKDNPRDLPFGAHAERPSLPPTAEERAEWRKLAESYERDILVGRFASRLLRLLDALKDAEDGRDEQAGYADVWRHMAIALGWGKPEAAERARTPATTGFVHGYPPDVVEAVAADYARTTKPPAVAVPTPATPEPSADAAEVKRLADEAKRAADIYAACAKMDRDTSSAHTAAYAAIDRLAAAASTPAPTVMAATCNDEYSGYICGRPAGHDGAHEASADDVDDGAAWLPSPAAHHADAPQPGDAEPPQEGAMADGESDVEPGDSFGATCPDPHCGHPWSCHTSQDGCLVALGDHDCGCPAPPPAEHAGKWEVESLRDEVLRLRDEGANLRRVLATNKDEIHALLVQVRELRAGAPMTVGQALTAASEAIDRMDPAHSDA